MKEQVLCMKVGTFQIKSHAIAWLNNGLLLAFQMHHLPVRLNPIVYINVDVVIDALFLFLSFISNILCVKNN